MIKTLQEKQINSEYLDFFYSIEKLEINDKIEELKKFVNKQINDVMTAQLEQRNRIRV
jgi:hypothetical protein